MKMKCSQGENISAEKKTKNENNVEKSHKKIKKSHKKLLGG